MLANIKQLFPFRENRSARDILKKQFPALMEECLKYTGIQRLIKFPTLAPKVNATQIINNGTQSDFTFDLFTLEGFERFYKTARPGGQDRFGFSPDGRVVFENIGDGHAEYMTRDDMMEAQVVITCALRSYFSTSKKIDYPQSCNLSKPKNSADIIPELGVQISIFDGPVYIKIPKVPQSNSKSVSAAFAIKSNPDPKDPFFYISEPVLNSATPKIIKIPTEPGEYVVGRDLQEEKGINVSNSFISKKHFVITVTPDKSFITIRELKLVTNKTVLANYTDPLQVQPDLHSDSRNDEILQSLKHELISLFREELLKSKIILSPTEIGILTGVPTYGEIASLQFNTTSGKFDYGKNFGSDAAPFLLVDRKRCLDAAKKRLSENNSKYFNSR